ncbi:hypothetical protein AOLI_G00142200 [Acnodon oligacanthus]
MVLFRIPLLDCPTFLPYRATFRPQQGVARLERTQPTNPYPHSIEPECGALKVHRQCFKQRLPVASGVIADPRKRPQLAVPDDCRGCMVIGGDLYVDRGVSS